MAGEQHHRIDNVIVQFQGDARAKKPDMASREKKGFDMFHDYLGKMDKTNLIRSRCALRACC